MSRKPLHFSDDEIINRLSQIEDLTKEDRTLLLHFVNAIAVKNQIKALAHILK